MLGLLSGTPRTAAIEGGRNLGTYLPARRGGSPAASQDNVTKQTCSEFIGDMLSRQQERPESEGRCPG